MDSLLRNVITVWMDRQEVPSCPVKAQFEVSQSTNHSESSEVTVDPFLTKKAKGAFQENLNQSTRTVSEKNQKGK